MSPNSTPTTVSTFPALRGNGAPRTTPVAITRRRRARIDAIRDDWPIDESRQCLSFSYEIRPSDRRVHSRLPRVVVLLRLCMYVRACVIVCRGPCVDTNVCVCVCVCVACVRACLRVCRNDGRMCGEKIAIVNGRAPKIPKRPCRTRVWISSWSCARVQTRCRAFFDAASMICMILESSPRSHEECFFFFFCARQRSPNFRDYHRESCIRRTIAGFSFHRSFQTIADVL